MAWFYGCWRVMRTPQSPTKGPDQDDLIRNMLKHSRSRRDLSMMRRIRGHIDTESSKGPDQDDLDQRYIETLQEEKGTFALQELGSRGLEKPRRKLGERNLSIAMKSDFGYVGCAPVCSD